MFGCFDGFGGLCGVFVVVPVFCVLCSDLAFRMMLREDGEPL